MSMVKKNKPRLLFYSDSWIRGGLQRAMLIIMEYLSKSYEIILVSTDLEIGGCYALDDSILHIKISNRYQDKIAERLVDLCVAKKVDLFVGAANYLPEFLDIYGMLAKLKIKSIAWEHNYYFFPCRISWTYPVFEKRIEAYKRANVAVWLTKFGTNIYSLMNKNGAYMPNPNPYEMMVGGLEHNKTKREKIVLMVGRYYDSVKRLDRALIVFKKVLTIHPKTKLVIVGGYDLGLEITKNQGVSIGELLNSLKIPSKSILFTGEQEEVEKYYKKASVLLLTSDNEAFPMVLNEAGHFKLPCVIFDIPGVEDIVLEGENGFIIPQDDYELMVEKIGRLLSDNNLCERMGKKAFELTKRFGGEKINKKWLNLVKMTLKLENQVELEKALVKDFQPTIKDKDLFMSILVREYENCIKRIISKPSEESSVIDKMNLKKLVSYIFNRGYSRIIKQIKKRVVGP